jgi:hypothetical protein
MITHSYEHAHVYPTPMSTFKRLDRLDLEIHEVGNQKRLVVDRYVTKRIISRKYNKQLLSLAVSQKLKTPPSD